MKLYATAVDMSGKRVGKLTVVSFLERSKRGNWWTCRCDCGNTNYKATAGDLRSGRITSCGCYRNSQEFADAHLVHGQRRQKKGETSRTYNAWCDMKKRCNNPSADNYPWYGGKGISYDPRWEDFNWFVAFMGECPSDFELSRKDHTKNYTADNCVWVEASVHAHEKKPRHDK